MTAEDIIQEVLLRIADIIIHGGNTPEKIVVSEKVMEALNNVSLMPRSLKYVDSIYYIADIMVEKGFVEDPKGEVWFKIE